MSHVADDPDLYLGSVVGSGQCVDYVREAAAVPHTSEWRRGAHVRDRPHRYGTAIATFDASGCYANATDNTSHAAILLGQSADGLVVNDQWVGQPVHERLIRFQGGAADPANDGDAFDVIET